MPAVGDLRNRILALADVSSPPLRAAHKLLVHRLPTDATPPALRRELEDTLRGLPPEAATHLHACLEAVGAGFDLRHASIGNLVLAGIWLAEERSLCRAADVFSGLVGARGTVRPVSEDDLHLAAELADGRVVVGQHRITRGDGGSSAGATVGGPPCPTAPITRVFLVRSLEDPTPTDTTAPAEVLDLIDNADLVCFPMGSFFTSVVASLLPSGIGAAVAASTAPKVYLPNPGTDPEERGLRRDDRVRSLARLLAPLDGVDIRTVDGIPRATGDPSRYDDMAVVGALRGLLSPS